MIFNTAIPSGGGGSSSWETVSYVEVGTFSGSVLTDGHLCVITSEPGQTMVDDGTSGYILSDLPEPAAPVFVVVGQGGYVRWITLAVDVDGNLLAYDLDELDASLAFDAFTIVYPVASS